jgi:predicted enzyme related to lactoylglutathione lyase
MPGTLQALIAAGATVSQEPTPVGGGRVIAILKDADENSIGLIYDEA